MNNQHDTFSPDMPALARKLCERHIATLVPPRASANAIRQDAARYMRSQEFNTEFGYTPTADTMAHWLNMENDT